MNIGHLIPLTASEKESEIYSSRVAEKIALQLAEQLLVLEKMNTQRLSDLEALSSTKTDLEQTITALKVQPVHEHSF